MVWEFDFVDMLFLLIIEKLLFWFLVMVYLKLVLVFKYILIFLVLSLIFIKSGRFR